jgi:hypothetical protein
MTVDLVRELSRLDPALRRDTVRAAKVQRHRQIRAAICRVRSELLADFSDRQAAHIIEDLSRGRHVSGLTAILRAEVLRMLIGEIGTLADMPSFERIRQHIEE